MKYFYPIAIVIIIILSAVFRLGFPDSAPFGVDEDKVACKISNFLDRQKFPPLIGKLHGVYTISIYGILIYSVMSFAHDPRIITLFMAGIPNTIAVILCFMFCYKFFDKRIAIVAAALFGFSNWAIMYSKSFLGVDMLQFFSILIFFTLMWGLYKSRPSIVFLSILLLPLLTNLHLTSFSILISVFLILIIYYSKMNRKYLFILAVMLIIAMLIPSIFGNFLNKKIGLDKNIAASFYTLNAMLTSINLIVRGGWYYLCLKESPRYPCVENFTEAFLRIIFIFGCIYVIKKMLKDLKLKHFSAYLIIGVWFFAFIAVFGFINLTNHAHYFMVVLPSLFIIASIGFFSIIDYISGKDEIQVWEMLLLSLLLIIWSPCIAILAILIMLFIRKFQQKISVFILYFLISFTLVFQAFSNIQLFIDINKKGGVAGRAGLDLGAKIKAVKFIIDDAELKFILTGEKSYYSIVNDEFYTYLFKYLKPKNADFISADSTGCVYHYIINGDINGVTLGDYLYNKKIGSKSITVEKVQIEA